MVRRYLAGTRRRVVDHGSVAGVDAPRRQLRQPLQRGQVATQRVARGVRPAAHVGGDLVEQHVAAQQAAAGLAEQSDVPVRMTGQVQHAERLVAQDHPVVLVHQPRGRRKAHAGAALGPGRGGRQLGRHAVVAQVALELVVRPLFPGRDRHRPVEPALHHLGGAAQLCQAGAGPDVVGVVVGQHQARHRLRPQLRERLRPPPQRRVAAEAGVDQRPAAGAGHRVAVHVVERPRQRHRDLDEPGLELGQRRFRHQMVLGEQPVSCSSATIQLS